MQIDQIEEPYKSEILRILKDESSYDSKLSTLKIYMLTHDYFKTISVDAAWLAYEVVKSYKNGRKGSV